MDFFAFVVAAMEAGTVRMRGLVTIRTGNKLGQGQIDGGSTNALSAS